MDQLAQAELVRGFMVRIAPEITRWILRNAENPDPESNAQMTLEWSIHLAAKYGACYDLFHAAENTPQTTDPIAEKLKEIAAGKPQAEGGTGSLS